MLRGVWQGTLKYILSMCFIPAAPQPALISVWEALILLQEFRKFRQRRTPSYPEETWGIILSSCKKGFWRLLGPALLRDQAENCSPNQQGITHCKTSLAQCQSISHCNNSSYAGTHTQKNPSPARAELRQMLNRSLSPIISLATAAGSLQVSATNLGVKACTE